MPVFSFGIILNSTFSPIGASMTGILILLKEILLINIKLSGGQHNILLVSQDAKKRFIMQ